VIEDGEGMSSGGGGTKLYIESQKRKHVSDKICCAELVNGKQSMCITGQLN
jgi:hypothetical protein